MLDIVTQQNTSFDYLEAEVVRVLDDPLMEEVNWNEVAGWGKSILVMLTNSVLGLKDPRKKSLLVKIIEFSEQHGYDVGLRLDRLDLGQ